MICRKVARNAVDGTEKKGIKECKRNKETYLP
jgi:hypothetical protein